MRLVGRPARRGAGTLARVGRPRHLARRSGRARVTALAVRLGGRLRALLAAALDERLRPVLVVPLAVGLLLGGVVGACGAWMAAGAASARDASQASVPAVRTAAPATTIHSPTGAPARTCLGAVEQADVVISYLIGQVRDRRLETSLHDYVDAARHCRKQVAP